MEVVVFLLLILVLLAPFIFLGMVVYNIESNLHKERMTCIEIKGTWNSEKRSCDSSAGFRSEWK
jgi:hypothetical protein